MILLPGEYITEKELPSTVIENYEKEKDEELLLTQFMANRPLKEIEKQVILATLKDCGGNKSETARRLGINRKTLHKKLKAYGID